MQWQQSSSTSHLEMSFIFKIICVFIIYLCYSMFKWCPGLKGRDRVTWAESLSHLYRILCEQCKNVKFKRKNPCTKYHLVKQPYTLSGTLYTFNQLLSEFQLQSLQSNFPLFTFNIPKQSETFPSITQNQILRKYPLKEILTSLSLGKLIHLFHLGKLILLENN